MIVVLLFLGLTYLMLPILVAAVAVGLVVWAVARLCRSRRRHPRPCRLPIDPMTAYLVFWKNDGACARCNVRLAPRRGLPQSFEVDHIIPFSKGGPCTIDNFQPLCQRCNRRKHDDV